MYNLTNTYTDGVDTQEWKNWLHDLHLFDKTFVVDEEQKREICKPRFISEMQTRYAHLWEDPFFRINYMVIFALCDMKDIYQGKNFKTPDRVHFERYYAPRDQYGTEISRGILRRYIRTKYESYMDYYLADNRVIGPRHKFSVRNEDWSYVDANIHRMVLMDGFIFLLIAPPLKGYGILAD